MDFLSMKIHPCLYYPNPLMQIVMESRIFCQQSNCLHSSFEILIRCNQDYENFFKTPNIDINNKNGIEIGVFC